MGNDVVVIDCVVEVACELVETDLQVDDQEGSVVEIQTLKWDSCCFQSTPADRKQEVGEPYIPLVRQSRRRRKWPGRW